MVAHRSHSALSVSLALEQQRMPTPKGSLAARRPLSDEVSELIARELIFSELIAPGALLPSEKELTERYGVSRVTIRAGLRTLKEAGLISVRQGVGALVLPRTELAGYDLERLCSLETLAREAGHELATENVEAETIEADQETATALALQPGEPVHVVRRVKVHEGSRVAWLVDHVRADLLPLAALRDHADASLLDVLLASERLAVDYADCEIEAVALPAEVAERLGVEAGAAGLLLDEIVCVADGRALARCTSWHRNSPEHSRFSVRRRRRLGD